MKHIIIFLLACLSLVACGGDGSKYIATCYSLGVEIYRKEVINYEFAGKGVYKFYTPNGEEVVGGDCTIELIEDVK